MTDEIIEESIETVIEMMAMIGTGTGPEKGHFPETIVVILDIEVQVVVDLGQDQE